MTKEQKLHREKLVLKYLRAGMSYEDVRNLMVKAGFDKTTVDTVKRIARDDLIKKMLKKNMKHKDIAEMAIVKGFTGTTAYVVKGVATKHKIKHNYAKSLKGLSKTSLSDRDQVIFECRKKNYSSTQINEELEKKGYEKISRQHISKLLQKFQVTCVE